MKTAARASLPTRYGTFEMSVYGTPERKEHVALTVGAMDDGEPVLVRVHSECLTGDVLGSSRCDARTAKHAAQPIESRVSEDEAGEDGPPLPEAHGARSRWARIGILDSRVEYPGMQAMTVEREEAVGCVTAS